MFTNHDEADDVPHYLSGEPTQAQWIAFWKARALRAEAEVKVWRVLAAARNKENEQ